jgi:hypothetical protein
MMRVGISQLGERQTGDPKVACSIHAHRIFLGHPTKPIALGKFVTSNGFLSFNSGIPLSQSRLANL